MPGGFFSSFHFVTLIGNHIILSLCDEIILQLKIHRNDTINRFPTQCGRVSGFG